MEEFRRLRFDRRACDVLVEPGFSPAYAACRAGLYPAMCSRPACSPDESGRYDRKQGAGNEHSTWRKIVAIANMRLREVSKNFIVRNASLECAANHIPKAMGDKSFNLKEKAWAARTWGEKKLHPVAEKGMRTEIGNSKIQNPTEAPWVPA